MMFRAIQTTPTPKAGIKGFYGINRKKKGSAGECVDCQNVDSDEFPCLRSVKGDKKVLTADGNIEKLIAPIGDNFELCGVVDSKLVGCGEFKNLGTSADKRVDNVLKFSDALVTLPNLWVYNLTDREVNKSDDAEYMKEKKSSENVRRIDNLYLFTLGRSYSSKDKRVNKKISYISINDTEWTWESDGTDYFIIDSIGENQIKSISGSSIYYECLQVHYYKKDENGIYKRTNHPGLDAIAEEAYTAFSSSSNYKKYTIKTADNEMAVGCGWYNRLWACSDDGREIRCSKVGELNNFSDYTAGAASSWFCEVGSDGIFTGIIPYNDALFAFKENHVHVVYGTTPQNFSMEKTFTGCGCIDGRSITVSNNALYWLGYNGIYRYTGNSPKLISENLNKKYKRGIAFSDNRKVFFNLTDYEGNKELLSFDTEKGLWHKYSYMDFIGGFSHDGKLYAYTTTEVYEIYGDEYGAWYFEGVTDYNDTFDDTAVSRFYIRAELRSGSTLKFEFRGISESDWEECGSYVADTDEMIKEYFTPRMRRDMAYQYRISGTGEAYIYECEKEVSAIGRKHNY